MSRSNCFSWPAYRFLKRQVRWSGIPISFQNFPQTVVIHTGFGIVNKAEIDVFLELSCFFDDPTDVGNLISWNNLYCLISSWVLMLLALVIWITTWNHRLGGPVRTSELMYSYLILSFCSQENSGGSVVCPKSHRYFMLEPKQEIRSPSSLPITLHHNYREYI